MKMWNKVFLGLIVVSMSIISTSATTTSKTEPKEQGRLLPVPLLPLLLVPPTAPTRHQLIWGLGIPNQLNYESIVYGLALKAQYYLPDGINTLKPSPIGLPGLGFNKRSNRDVGWDAQQQMKYENYTGVIEVVTEEAIKQAREKQMFEELKSEPDKEVKGMTRWDLYEALEAAAKRYGLGDRECILRAICEAAEVPLTHESGIFGELAQMILSPSTSPDRIKRNSDNEYLFAEHVGRSEGSCEYVFRSCEVSLLEQFTGIHDPSLYEMVDDDV